jgi:3-oxoacyl-[acyl-carrier protein] reductase
MTVGFNLGIAGRIALVCGSSSGLGRACATALAQGAARIILNGRTEEKLRETQRAIRELTGATVDYVVADVTTIAGRQLLLQACPSPDILVNNAAGPPAGDFRLFDEESWNNAVTVSMVSPIMLIKAVIDGMITRRWGRIINITSSAVKAPLPLLGLSNGARSGLTGFVAGLAREVAPFGVTINNILPGRFSTDRLNSYIAKIAEHDRLSFQEAATRMAKTNPMGRFGQPAELGAFCAFLSSDAAAYFTGQNVLIDGGEYPGL